MKLPALIQQLERRLVPWVPTQPWYPKTQSPPREIKIIEHEVMRDAWPKLLWTLIECDGDAVYQVPIGLREASNRGAVLLGHERALIGEAATEDCEVVAYDAMVDSVLGSVLFDVVTDGSHTAKSMRPLGAEQSNTSVVFDNRLTLKVFRRLPRGTNPDLEVTLKLTEAGFRHVPPIVATWRRNNWDLAVCYGYLYDGTSGRQLAMASVRDLFGADTVGASSAAGSPAIRIDQTDPAAAGGDFAEEARRLGNITGELHVTLAAQFPVTSFDPATLVQSLGDRRATLPVEHHEEFTKLVDSVGTISTQDAGKAIRVHGDYHLGRTLRSVLGWYIFGFEGDRAAFSTRGPLTTSPLKDVADMMRSFQYAMLMVRRNQMQSDDSALELQSVAWEKRNRNAFREGYLGAEGIEEIVPPDADTRALLVRAFLLNKAIQELDYANTHGLSWASMAQASLDRILSTTV